MAVPEGYTIHPAEAGLHITELGGLAVLRASFEQGILPRVARQGATVSADRTEST